MPSHTVWNVRPDAAAQPQLVMSLIVASLATELTPKELLDTYRTNTAQFTRKVSHLLGSDSINSTNSFDW